MCPREFSHLPLLNFDKEKSAGFRYVVGVDEAGRGPLAGPVVSAAVCLRTTDFSARIGDSKTLTPLQRQKAFHEICEMGWFGIGIMNETVIDSINILRAAHLAMTVAVRDMVSHLPKSETEDRAFTGSVKVLVDGNRFFGRLPFKVEPIVAADAKSLAVACASIVAKVYRDRLMEKYDAIFPQYGFREHKGYSTLAHREAIEKHGLCPIHRKTFNTCGMYETV